MRMDLGRPGRSIVQGHQTWLAKHVCTDLELVREAGWRKVDQKGYTGWEP